MSLNLLSGDCPSAFGPTDDDSEKGNPTFLKAALLEVIDREHRRLSRVLHDNLCQLLLGAAFSIKAAGQSLPSTSPAAIELTSLARLVSDAVQETREVIRSLKGGESDCSNLYLALSQLAQRYSKRIPCRLEYTPPITPLAASEIGQVCRITEEAVENAIRHARATEIIIWVGQNEHGFLLEIRDNGHGSDPDGMRSQGMGLLIMKLRAETVRGHIQVESSSGRGTKVRLQIPP